MSDSVQAQYSHRRPPHSIFNKKKNIKGWKRELKIKIPLQQKILLTFAFPVASLMHNELFFFSLLTSVIEKYWIFLFTCGPSFSVLAILFPGAHKGELHGVYIIRRRGVTRNKLSHSGTVLFLQSTYPYFAMHCWLTDSGVYAMLHPSASTLEQAPKGPTQCC